MKRHNIHLVASELHFYKSEGWQLEHLLSCLDQGELSDKGKFYRLSHDPSPASFNVERLTDLAGDVIDFRGKALMPKEREIALKYHSQHGVFLRGDDSNWKAKKGRLEDSDGV